MRMMIRSAYFLSSMCGVVIAIGASNQHGDTPASGREMRADGRFLDNTFSVGEIRFGSILELLESSHDDAMSMSMSFNYNPTPSVKPVPSKTPRPSQKQPVKPSLKPSERPSSSPSPSETASVTSSVTSIDSTSPSETPSGSAAPSLSPSASGSSTPGSLTPVAQADTYSAYECVNGVIMPDDHVNSVKTLVELKVTYAADVRGTAITLSTLSDLELALLESAIAAALGCGTSNRRFLQEQHRALLPSTNKIGSCDSDFSKSSCFVLETELAFVLNMEVNPEYAEYLSYVAIRAGMSSDKFVDNNEEIHQLTYIAPLPLVAPSSTSQPLEEEPARNGESANQVPHWIIGACVAVVAVGFVGTGAWLYKRRRAAQQEQKKEPSEVAADSVSESPSGESLFYADGDFIEDIDIEG